MELDESDGSRSELISKSHIFSFFVCSAFCASASGISFAQTVSDRFSWGYSYRARYESKQDYNFSNSSQDYLLTRTRLNLRWNSNDRNEFFAELQDARVAGEDGNGVPRVGEKAKGTIFADDLDLHQAWWDRKFDTGVLRIGRQKLNFGDNRLVAALEWVNTARVHDGVRLSLNDVGGREVDLFATALVAVDPGEFNDQSVSGSRYLDSDFHGIYVTDPVSTSLGELHYWYFYRSNSGAGDKVNTLGLRFTRNDGNWRPDVQFAWQDGEFGGLDHSAGMLSAGVRRNFNNDVLSIVYNYGTGDSQPTDDRHETFDNLFPLNHPYYGFMDLFSLQNIRNFEVSYRKQIASTLSLYVSLSDFSLNESADAWYSAGLAPIRVATGAADRHVGSEIDIAVQGRLFGGRVSLDAGISALRSGSYLDSFGLSGTATFLYASLLYSWSSR